MQKIAALVLATAALAAAGCGSSGSDVDRKAAYDAVRAYLIATEQRDFARRCDELVTRDAVERAGGRAACIRAGKRTPRDFRAKDFKFDIQDVDHDAAQGELVHEPTGDKLVYRVERDRGRLRVDGIERPVRP